MTRRLRHGTGCLGVSVGEPKECSGRAKSPLLIATHGNFAVRESLAGGTDAPTPARTVGLPSRGGQYFLSARKKVPKKASGTATTGKSPLLPILTAGLAMSRAMELDSFHQLLERAPVLTFFRRQNGRAFFPPLPIAALLRHSWRGAYSTLAGWDASTKTGHFYNAKGQREIQSTLAFSASHEARRRMAVFAVQLAGICTRPASREACRRAAVKPRPSYMSLEQPCAHSAQSGVQGVTPCPV